MFEIGFSELLLVGLVALLVFGPERLPGAARTAGLWIGRLKRSFNAIKSEVEREIGADEIRRQLHNEQILQMERELKQAQQAAIAPPSPSVPAAAAEPAASPVPRAPAGAAPPHSQPAQPAAAPAAPSEPPRPT